jgi:putative effector of murein hydrolase
LGPAFSKRAARALLAGHGIGTSHAFSVNAEAKAYASLGMGLHGIAGAVLIPYAVGWWF